MRNLHVLVFTLAILVLISAPALARGAGGGGGGGGGMGGGNGGGNGPSSGATVGAGRGTALSNPGSTHRSDTANDNLEARTPGKAHPHSGVKAGGGKVGTVPTTPGHTESR
jgi:hypothetical protein